MHTFKTWCRRFILSLAILFCTSTLGFSQEFGLSFSYFLPRDGYFSTPVSPFSIRGLGVNLNEYFALQTGGSLYIMPGLNVIDLPFESRRPIMGPSATIFIPAELVVQFAGRTQEFNIKGGGFAFYSLFPRLHEGNLDRAIRKFEGWDLANSDMDFDNNPGVGFHFGAEYVYYFRKFGLSLEVNYLMGSSNLGLSGNYTGGTLPDNFETKEVSYDDAKVDFTGFEISIGVIVGG